MELNTLLLPLGIIPAIFILYVVIGGHEGKFQERYIFLTFIIGILLGAIIYILEGMTMYRTIVSSPNIVIFALFSLIFSFLDQLVKTAILNLRRFSDEGTPLYGVSFSTGFSAAFAALLFGENLQVNLENVALVVLPIGFLLVNGATGILIGTGIKRKLQTSFFGKALALGWIMWLYVFISITLSLSGRHLLSSISAVISVGMAAALFYTTLLYHLPHAMMDRRELRKVL